MVNGLSFSEPFHTEPFSSCMEQFVPQLHLYLSAENQGLHGGNPSVCNHLSQLFGLLKSKPL